MFKYENKEQNKDFDIFSRTKNDRSSEEQVKAFFFYGDPFSKILNFSFKRKKNNSGEKNK